MTKLATNWR